MKDGAKRYATKVIVNEIVMLPKGAGSAGGEGEAKDGGADCPF